MSAAWSSWRRAVFGAGRNRLLDACGRALNRWLVGQLVSMVLVGTTTGVGLWLAGVPSPLALA
jgi:predicted PurR-regulated permease PerM